VTIEDIDAYEPTMGVINGCLIPYPMDAAPAAAPTRYNIHISLFPYLLTIALPKHTRIVISNTAYNITYNS
jgi:hypothetical protein